VAFNFQQSLEPGDAAASSHTRKDTSCGAIENAFGCRKGLCWQLEIVDKQVQAEIDKLPAMKRRQELLLEVVGVGPITSCTRWWSNCRNWVRSIAANSRRWWALVGVAPFDDESGTISKPRVIQGGRAHVRSALYMATVTGITSNAVLKAHYQHLLQAGKAPKVALVACMRKLLIHLNSILANDAKQQLETDSNPQIPEAGNEGKRR
jgi:transposase